MSEALPTGDWVLKGGRRVFVPADPAWHPVDDETTEQQLWDRIAANLEADGFIDLTPVTGDLCDACGCLLAPQERCPNCLVWAIKDEQQWQWQVARDTRRDLVWAILDHRNEHRKAA